MRYSALTLQRKRIALVFQQNPCPRTALLPQMAGKLRMPGTANFLVAGKFMFVSHSLQAMVTDHVGWRKSETCTDIVQRTSGDDRDWRKFFQAQQTLQHVRRHARRVRFSDDRRQGAVEIESAQHAWLHKLIEPFQAGDGVQRLHTHTTLRSEVRLCEWIFVMMRSRWRRRAASSSMRPAQR